MIVRCTSRMLGPVHTPTHRTVVVRTIPTRFVHRFDTVQFHNQPEHGTRDTTTRTTLNHIRVTVVVNNRESLRSGCFHSPTSTRERHQTSPSPSGPVSMRVFL